jgi:hypothetical protein
MAGWMKRSLVVGGVVVGVAAAVAGNLMTCRGTDHSVPQTARESPVTIVHTAPASPASPPTARARTLRLEGQVIDEQQRPVAAASVALWTTERPTIASEADGSFAFDGLAAGQYRLVATKDDLTSEPTLVTLTDKNEPVIIHMRVGATVVVRVIEADGGAPIASATVSEHYGRKATTGLDGIATLRGIGPTIAALTATAPGHASIEDSFAVGSDPTSPIQRTITLPRGAPLGGVVLGPDEKPVASASIYAEPAGRSADRQIKVESDASGTWKFEALARGKYALTADSESYGQAPAQYVEVDGVHERSGVIVHVVMLGHSFCDGDRADVTNVPPGNYRVCIDEKHCASVIATATPATQQVELHATP